ncbi:MAG: hypothetical protein AB7F64_01435 [Gammaproteobacteria bacterium]
MTGIDNKPTTLALLQISGLYRSPAVRPTSTLSEHQEAHRRISLALKRFPRLLQSNLTSRRNCKVRR